MIPFWELGIWLLLAATFWDLPTYLYGTGRTTFIDRPLLHSAWFLLGMVVTILIFQTNFIASFAGVSPDFAVLFAVVFLA